jgi:PAS domain S-box-containing protein
MLERIRAYSRSIARFLRARSPQEREKRAAQAFALLLVATVAIFRHVTGLTVDHASFTLYTVAVAASAARGGMAAAVVALLASILAARLGATVLPGPPALLLFTAEGLSVAVIVSVLRSRLLERRARLAQAETTIAQLTSRDRHRRVLDAALRHLEDSSGDTAIVVLNEAGTMTEWRASPERMYGYPASEMIGESAASLFFEAPSAAELRALLHQPVEGSPRRSSVHRRRDGTRLDVEVETRPFRNADARGITLVVHDTAERREWEDYREAAAQAQAALQQAADDTRQQLAALESMTDPSLNLLDGDAVVTELLERLRVTVGADGAALAQPCGVVSARGLQPLEGPVSADRLPLTPGRVAVVHNDPARVEQLSALRWPADVASLLAVPVVHNGQVWSSLEIVSERSRRVSDWDVALARIVADRLAAVVVQRREVPRRVGA